MGQCIVFAGLNEPSTPVCFTHEGGERPMSLKLQNQLCKVQNRRVFVFGNWAEKNTLFFGNALPKSNAHAHLKQRKKHNGLSVPFPSAVRERICLQSSMTIDASRLMLFLM